MLNFNKGGYIYAYATTSKDLQCTDGIATMKHPIKCISDLELLRANIKEKTGDDVVFTSFSFLHREFD